MAEMSDCFYISLTQYLHACQYVCWHVRFLDTLFSVCLHVPMFLILSACLLLCLFRCQLVAMYYCTSTCCYIYLLV